MSGHKKWNKLRGQRGSRFDVIQPVELPTTWDREDLLYYRDNPSPKPGAPHFRNTTPGRILRNWGDNGRSIKDIKRHLDDGYVPCDPRRELGIYSTVYSAFSVGGGNGSTGRGTSSPRRTMMANPTPTEHTSRAKQSSFTSRCP